MAEVAIVYSDKERFIPVEERDHEAFRGMYYAMLRARIPFDMVHVGRMDEEALAPYKLLILPNIGALSDDQAEDVQRFVRRGGSVIIKKWCSPRLEAGSHAATRARIPKYLTAANDVVTTLAFMSISVEEEGISHLLEKREQICC